MAPKHILWPDELNFLGLIRKRLRQKMRIRFRNAGFLDEDIQKRYLDESAKRMVWIVYLGSAVYLHGALRMPA